MLSLLLPVEHPATKLLFPHSPTHRDAHRLAPLADAIAAGVIDDAVSPLRGRARERLRIGVAENSADGEGDETFAVAAIHLEFAFVQVGGETAPIPRDPDVHVAQNRVDGGREHRVIRAGLIGVFKTDGFSI
jgi:hypothetical protein